MLLNTHDLPWETVEHLVVAIALDVDGATDARRYGRPGQTQEGIDVVAQFADEPTRIYQSKRWQQLTAGDLQGAVEKYAEGSRPLDANHIVVVATADTSDTAVIQRLQQLRERYDPMTIELWGREQLSNILRPHPTLVERFFGFPTAEIFCQLPRQSSPDTGEPPFSDALLRGPLAALDLEQQLADAMALQESQPADSARILGNIADSLEASQYAPYASALRSRQAKALRAAGDVAGATRAALTIIVTSLYSGDPWRALAMHGQLDRNLPPDLDRTITALAAIADYEHNHTGTLDNIAATIDNLERADLHQLDAAAFFAEHALAERRDDLILARTEVLGTIAQSAPVDHRGKLLKARILACIADVTGDWRDLSRAARTEYPPKVSALLLARHGRYLAYAQKPDAAVERYYDAVQHACNAEAYADAADWLFAIRAIGARYGMLEPPERNAYNSAQALRSAGNDSVIPAPFSPRERALVRLQDDNHAEALSALRRYHWRAVVLASWADEQEAHQRIGQLYMRTGRIHEAVERLIYAGSASDLKRLSEHLRDKALHLPDAAAVKDWVPWERVCAFHAAAAGADFLTDGDARQWAGAALEEVRAARPAAKYVESPYEAALKAFARLADSASHDDAAEFLAIAESLLHRPAGQHRPTDQSLATALVRVADSHGELQAQAVTIMCASISINDSLADTVLKHGEGALRAQSGIVGQACSQLARNGNTQAAVALVLAQAGTADAVGVARRDVAIGSTPHSHTSGERSYFAGWQYEAILATILDAGARTQFAEAMAAMAQDRQHVGRNRAHALETIAMLAPHLDDDVRDRHFALALLGARGELDGSVDDEIYPSDPFDRIRLSWSVRSLVRFSIIAAGALAHNTEQYDTVRSTVDELVVAANDDELRSIARALSLMHGAHSTMDPIKYADHRSEWLRAFAARLWCEHDGHPWELGARLVADLSPHVRGTMAALLPSSERFAHLRDLLRNDVRRTIRRRANLHADE